MAGPTDAIVHELVDAVKAAGGSMDYPTFAALFRGRVSPRVMTELRQALKFELKGEGDSLVHRVSIREGGA